MESAQNGIRLKWNKIKMEQGVTNYVDKFLAFFDHLPPFVDSSYLIKIYIFGLPTHLS